MTQRKYPLLAPLALAALLAVVGPCLAAEPDETTPEVAGSPQGLLPHFFEEIVVTALAPAPRAARPRRAAMASGTEGGAGARRADAASQRYPRHTEKVVVVGFVEAPVPNPQADCEKPGRKLASAGAGHPASGPGHTALSRKNCRSTQD